MKIRSIGFVLAAVCIAATEVASADVYNITGTVKFIQQNPDGYTVVQIKPPSAPAVFVYRAGPLNLAAIGLSDAASDGKTVTVGYNASTGEFQYVTRSF